jgi:hypothetical protein
MDILKIIFISASGLILITVLVGYFNQKVWGYFNKFMGMFWWVYPSIFIILTIWIAIECYKA